MRRDLEASRPIAMPAVAYTLLNSELPFALQFARRRRFTETLAPLSGATQSDGATTSNEGDGGPEEEFDWLDDD
jgi:hypothetical protein